MSNEMITHMRANACSPTATLGLTVQYADAPDAAGAEEAGGGGSDAE